MVKIGAELPKLSQNKTGYPFFGPPCRSSNGSGYCVIENPIYDFLLVINSNLCLISHRLATIHPLQTTNRQTTTRVIDASQHSCSPSESVTTVFVNEAQLQTSWSVFKDKNLIIWKCYKITVFIDSFTLTHVIVQQRFVCYFIKLMPRV